MSQPAELLAQVVAQLAVIPALLRELEVTLTRQHQFLQRHSGGRPSGEFPLPFHVAASKAADDISVVLRAHCAAVADRIRQHPPTGSMTARARWLRVWVPMLAEDTTAIEALAQALGEVIDAAETVVDRPEDLMYVGACEQCRMPLYTAPDAEEGACRRCRTVFYPRKLREMLLARARYRFHTAGELARLLPWFDDRPVTEAAITKAGERGTLTRYKIGGRVVYQIGDVIDWHRARSGGATGFATQ
ncbi:hypothetical protein [Nocardia sp. CC213A]|uniref:hypothetical protein n=1 Tax=Nocardia sp. CC213A TaxID=3044157 RepID=UPI00278C66A1|nr:hypothetical protein [Nocardia sp. CC213A]